MLCVSAGAGLDLEEVWTRICECPTKTQFRLGLSPHVRKMMFEKHAQDFSESSIYRKYVVCLRNAMVLTKHIGEAVPKNALVTL